MSNSRLHLRALLFIVGAACLFFLPCSHAASTQSSRTLRLSTSDATLELAAGPHEPSVRTLIASGQVAWHNTALETLPASVEQGGSTLPLTWTRRPALDIVTPRRVVLVYESAHPQLRLRWEWQARAAFGPVEHTITVENLSREELWLPLLDSLRLDWRVDPETQVKHFYVEKGADTPSAEGIHLTEVDNSYQWTGWSTTYAHPTAGRGREIIPYSAVFRAGGSESGWFAGIEFSGRTRFNLRRSDTGLQAVLGLDPDPGPFKTRLPPGESFVTPTVFLGAFSSGPDGAGNQLRPWVRAVLNSPRTWSDPHYPITVNNSWGSGMLIDEPHAHQMILDSAELGLEMFHVDAGWFRGVGDWYPDPKKFPHGLAALSDDAHQHGLRFGIWVDWAQAGVDTADGALNVRDPKTRDWLVAPVAADWKPEEFKGQTIDLGVPAAHEYAVREVNRIVDDYRLDMLEHDGYLVANGCTATDHPHAPPDTANMSKQHDSGFDFILSANSTDVSYHAVRAYYEIYERLRRSHPGLLLEICNDGGRMVDFGSAAHGDYFSVTDSYDPLSNRRAFFDTSYALPAAMLESYVERWPTPKIENFRYMLRSGMMGWLTIMQDTNAWTPEQHAAARDAIALYKRALRPLIRDAHLYHISSRPDGVHWDAIEYWNPTRSRGVVYAFRGSIADEPEHTFVLAGLLPTHRYHLHFQDGSSPDVTLSGGELMKRGLALHLPAPLSSELLFLEEVSSH